jgi:hypothetical protein
MIRGMAVRVLWVADDEDEASYAGAASAGGLVVEWARVAPGVEEMGRYDVVVADPGALRVGPEEFERRVHEDLPSTPVVFYSGLRAEHHARGGTGLRWSMPTLVTWLTHAEAPLVSELPRQLEEIGRAR